jgi:transcription antitermination factor NusG
MECNWYIICTKQLQEKKVISALNKRGIKNYCPQVVMNNDATFKRTNEQPLFNSYVFAFINASEIPVVKSISKVINVMYWCNKEVIISNEEIEAIRLMTENYNNIKIQQTAIDTTACVSIFEETSNEIRSNFLAIKHLGLEVTLPSLGLKLIASGNRMQHNLDQIKTFISNIKNTANQQQLSFK